MSDWYQKAIDKLGWVEVTKWATVNNGIHHNHFEFGHVKNTVPIGSKSQTKKWANQKWQRHYVYALKDSQPLIFC